MTDFQRHGLSPFPPEIATLLRRVEELGVAAGRDPLGQHWPFSPRESDWERGRNLEEGKAVLQLLIERLLEGRGDEILLDPRTGKPLAGG